MAVAFDAHTESHTGTTGSASEASFSWSHAGASSGVKGFLLFTFVNTNADDALSVTYGGVNVPAVTGGRAVDTALEPGDAKAWFLGSGVPQGTQTVVVTRNNNTNVMWGNSVTVLASADTEPFGVLLEQEDQAMTEENIDDGSPGSNSLRFCGVNSGKPGGADVPAGANSTDMGFIDFTPRVIKCVRETTAGQGARPVGIVATSDDIAAVYLAVREAGAATQTLTGSLFTKAPTFPNGVVTRGAVALTGSLFTKAPTFPTGILTARYNLTGSLFTKAPTFFTGAVTATRALTGVLFTKAPTFPTGTVTSTYALTGTLFQKAPTFPQGAVTAGAGSLTGVLFVKAPTFFTGTVTAGAVNLTGTLFTKAPTFPTGAISAAYSLTGTLFVKAPTFPTGTIGQAGTLFGNLFTKTPTFFTGSLTSGAPSFWQPDPAGWTANPSAFVRVGRYGPSPWGAELSGQRFDKAPTFPVGAVS